MFIWLFTSQKTIYNETFNKVTKFKTLVILNIFQKKKNWRKHFLSLVIIVGHECHVLSVWHAYFQTREFINHRLSNWSTTLACHNSYMQFQSNISVKNFNSELLRLVFKKNLHSTPVNFQQKYENEEEIFQIKTCNHTF